MVHNFHLLIKKNFIVEKRCWIKTIIEIIIIIIIFLISMAIMPESHTDALFRKINVEGLTDFK